MKLLNNKKCGKCGHVFHYVPEDAKLVGGIYWWNCECNSTLTSLTEEMKRELGIPRTKGARYAKG